MRGFAQQFLAYEAAAQNGTEPNRPAVFCVFEALRRPLSVIAGASGFRVLLGRALTRATAQVPTLSAVQVKPDDSLEPLSNLSNNGDPEASIVLLAQLLGLLAAFIGEGVLLRILLDLWPDLTARLIETTPFHQQTIAINQALVIGSVRQHELTEAATEALQRSNEELRRANGDLEQFAYFASHDLQEPLRAVTSCTQLLAAKLSGLLDEEAEHLIEEIVEGNRRMRALIKDLLAYARSGVEQQGTVPVDCGEALGGALANLKSSLEETHAAITCDPLPWVNANLPELTQLFQNLIGNALKYRKADCPPNIHIAAEARGDEWVVSVRDNGIGFDPQYAGQIFGVFKRLHNRQYPGTGIGLAICKRIVERHRGTIWAIGEAGKGATFFFAMPRAAGEAARAVGRT